MKKQTTQEIMSRIREVGNIVFAEWGAARRFCLKYDLNYSIFRKTLNENLKDEPKRYFDVATISYIVLEFGVSADWILTGRGSMMQNVNKMLNQENE